MKNKKSSHIGMWLMIALIAVISYFAFMGALKDGITLNKDNGNGVTNVTSLSELKDKVYFELDIPSYVTDADEELHIEVVAGQVVVINNTKFVMKASIFANVNADILGLYEKSNVEKCFFVNNSNIIYFKYRQGYNDYPNCTIINWHTNETSYGLMIEDNVSFSDALSIIGIDELQLSEDVIESNTEDRTKYDVNEFKEYMIEDKIYIKLPHFSGCITHVDTYGVSAFFADDTLLFLVVYNDEDIQNNTYSEQSVVNVSDSIKIYYDSINTYDKGSDAYSDYELMLLTIDDIAKTIVYK